MRILTKTHDAAGNVGAQDALLSLEVEPGALALSALGLRAALLSLKVRLGEIALSTEKSKSSSDGATNNLGVPRAVVLVLVGGVSETTEETDVH